MSSLESWRILAESIEKEYQLNCELIKLYKEIKTMEKEFTKADLKNRMVVEYRDGQRRMVVDNVLMGVHGHANLAEYFDDLTNYWDSNLDIIKVFDKVNTFSKLSEKDLSKTILWERKEIKEVTMKEIAEKFGCEVKIIDG